MFLKNSAKSGILCVTVNAEPALPAPVLRRRSVLKSSASRRALLAVQAAMSVGITLAGPLPSANAQTNLPASSNTVVLSHYGVGDNPFSISNGTVIGTDFYGVYGSTGRYTITNAGTVTSSQADGILLKGGGTITNSGTVAGAVSGHYAGIVMQGRVSTVANSGLITGNAGVELLHGGILYNTGSIAAGSIGVDIQTLQGKVINNGAEDANYISGGDYGVVIGAANGTLITRGFIGESSYNEGAAAVQMNGGYVDNQAAGGGGAAGVIRGNNYGVASIGAQALRVNNQGSIEGFWSGLNLGAAGGNITNGGNGYILGFHYAGINAAYGSLHVSNAGTITGGDYGIDAFTREQAGLLGGVSVSNSGTILGSRYGIYVNTGFGSVNNSGTIFGGERSGVELYTSGYVNNTGSIIGGQNGVYIAGSIGVVHNNGLFDANYISGANAGVLITAPDGTLITRGLITQSAGGAQNAAVIMNGGYIYNQASAWIGKGVISGYANGVIANGTNAINIINNGIIEGTGVTGDWTNGIILGAGGGTVTNGTGALISGSNGNGILSNYGSFAVANAGTIIGDHYGIDSYQRGTVGTAGGVSVSNSGTVYGHDGGIYVGTGYASINNTGLIEGGNYDGVNVQSGASVFNAGTIAGGYYGIEAYNGLNATNHSTIIGGYDGIFVYHGTASITNTGTIIGMQFNGINLRDGGVVNNSGTITGGYNGIITSGNPAAISNSGVILGAAYTGVKLHAGGSVYNGSTGTIAGGYEGVLISGGYGSVVNHGLIQGGKYAGVGIYQNGTVANIGGTISGANGVQFGYIGDQVSSTGSVFNAGVIIGNSFAGVAMFNGGQIYNAPGGTIATRYSAGDGVVVYGGFGSVNNEGTILGGQIGNGVYLAAGGRVFNGGTIHGGTGVKIGGTIGAEVYNAGLITGGSVGVELLNGGYVGNGWRAGCDQQIGVIYGSRVGVQIDNTFGVVNNFGTIMGGRDTDIGTGVLLNGGGVVENGDFVMNSTLHVGDIYGGGTGVLAQNTASGVFNEGFIGGSFAGVALMNGGGVYNAVYHTTIGGDPVSFAGTIIGDTFGVLVSDAASGSVRNAGYIRGNYAGVNLLGGGSISNAASGAIIGRGYGVKIASTPGYVSNAGLINGYEHVGAYLTEGGTVINSGMIAGWNVGVLIGNNIVDTLASAGTVLNTGHVYASAGTGIVMLTGGYISNSSSGLINGHDEGVYLYANGGIANAVFNAGSIIGDTQAGMEVRGDGLFNLTNASTGTIIGSQGVYIHAATLGTDVISNAGLILGTNDNGLILNGDGAFYVENTGTIMSERSNGTGLSTDARQLSVSNAGLIYGRSYGINSSSSLVNITNLQSGTISGYNDDGIFADGGQLSVDNAGQISSGGYEGVAAYDGSLDVILNESTGTIYGNDYGLDLEDAVNLVDNRGLITAYNDDGVYVDGTYAGILNEAGGTISGGDYGIYAEASSFALDNAGLITTNGEDGIYSYYTSRLINEAGGTITGPGYGVWFEGDYGSVQNAGLIEGDYAVVMENSLGSVLNTDTGTIAGAREGVFTDLGEGVSNQGLIIGTSYIGIQLYGGGELVNTGTVLGGEIGVNDYGGTAGGTYSNFLTIFNAGTISGGNIGVDLYPVTGDEIANAAGGLINGGSFGIQVGYANASAATAGTIYNAGSIDGGQAGIDLANGGLVGNEKGGTITGGVDGIEAGYAGDTLANTAIIVNSGAISGGADGVLLTQGGIIQNSQPGIIIGGVDGIDAPGVTNIANDGLITGGTTGIALGAGGSIVNKGVISGGVDGIDFAQGEPAYIKNAGRITGTSGVGIQLEGGTLINQASGVIQGGADGVIASDGATIVNAGKIADRAAPHHTGVVLYGNTSLTNLATGTISGATGVLVSGDQATIVDEGAIISTDGGDAIQILPSADPAQITLTTGSKLTGSIDGGGTAGTITLTGKNTLGNTISNFGSGSSLTVAPGAVWTGLGNWTIANVNNTGTFQGGTLTTPLNVTGNFASTGTLQVLVTPTISTVLNVSGTATFSGALSYIFAPGTYTPGYKYDFVNAAGGASGKFTSVNYVGATPGYVSKTTSVVISGNTLGSNLVLGRVSPLDGSIFSDANQDAALNAQAANDALLGKAAGDEDANAAACAAATQVMPDRTDVHGTNLASKMTQAVANAFCGAGGWIEATGSTMTIDNSNGAPGYTGNDAGFLAGLDRPVGDLGTKLGVAVGYDNAWLDDKAHGKASTDTIRVGLYAAQPIGRFTITADMMYGDASNSSTRETGIGAASGKYDGNVFNGGVQISTGLDVNGVSVTPAAGIKFADISNDGFTETAPSGLKAFAVAPQTSSYTSIQPYLDVGMSKSFTTESLVTITPSVSLGYQFEAGSRGKSVDVKTLDSTLFAGGHTNLDAGGAKIGASIAAGKNNWSLYAKYDATLAGNYTAQAGEAGLQIRF